jgi:hypothetical protein
LRKAYGIRTIKKRTRKFSTFFWKKESGAKKTSISAGRASPYKAPAARHYATKKQKILYFLLEKRKWSKENQC